MPDLASAEGVKALVVKPSLIGGIEASEVLALEAKAKGVKVVLSSAFESSVGLACIAALAAGLGSHSSEGTQCCCTAPLLPVT